MNFSGDCLSPLGAKFQEFHSVIWISTNYWTKVGDWLFRETEILQVSPEPDVIWIALSLFDKITFKQRLTGELGNNFWCLSAEACWAWADCIKLSNRRITDNSGRLMGVVGEVVRSKEFLISRTRFQWRLKTSRFSLEIRWVKFNLRKNYIIFWVCGTPALKKSRRNPNTKAMLNVINAASLVRTH